MKTCLICGAVVPDTAKFCRECGSPLTGSAQQRMEYIPDPEDRTAIIAEEEQPGVMSEPEAPEEFRRYDAPPQRENPYEEQGYGYSREQEQPRERVQRPQQMPPGRQPQMQTAAWDHTAEFDPKDISENKVVAMLVYLLGWVGIIIALLAANTSPYAAFHVRQGLKFVVLNCLIGLAAAAVLVVLVPISMATMVGGMQEVLEYGAYNPGGMLAGSGFLAFIYILLGLFALALGVIKVICFFSICKGNAKEPPIVRAFGFLR